MRVFLVLYVLFNRHFIVSLYKFHFYNKRKKIILDLLKILKAAQPEKVRHLARRKLVWRRTGEAAARPLDFRGTEHQAQVRQVSARPSAGPEFALKKESHKQPVGRILSYPGRNSSSKGQQAGHGRGCHAGQTSVALCSA
jgi:hypothetical protein